MSPRDISGMNRHVSKKNSGCDFWRLMDLANLQERVRPRGEDLPRETHRPSVFQWSGRLGFVILGKVIHQHGPYPMSWSRHDQSIVQSPLYAIPLGVGVFDRFPNDSDFSAFDYRIKVFQTLKVQVCIDTFTCEKRKPSEKPPCLYKMAYLAKSHFSM